LTKNGWQPVRTGWQKTRTSVIYQWNFPKRILTVSANLIFNLIVPNKTTSVANEIIENNLITSLFVYVFNEVMRLIMRENHWLLRFLNNSSEQLG
jgi:hypothetical protein